MSQAYLVSVLNCCSKQRKMSGKQQQNGSSKPRHHVGTVTARCPDVLRSKGRVVVPPADLAGAGLSPLAAPRDRAAPFSGGGWGGPRLVPFLPERRGGEEGQWQIEQVALFLKNVPAVSR